MSAFRDAFDSPPTVLSCWVRKPPPQPCPPFYVLESDANDLAVAVDLRDNDPWHLQHPAVDAGVPRPAADALGFCVDLAFRLVCYGLIV